LHILAAEAEHLVNVSIQLTSQTHEAFEKRLVDAFLSDNESDSAGAWNEQRRQVIREALDKYLLPAGVKYVKEWLKEEIEETLAKRCGDLLEEVSLARALS
jgi:transcription elongation factor SPT6